MADVGKSHLQAAPAKSRGDVALARVETDLLAAATNFRGVDLISDAVTPWGPSDVVGKSQMVTRMMASLVKVEARTGPVFAWPNVPAATAGISGY